ncbi:Sec-independent protein translocase TatB, partial [Streptomyces sp. 2MCAF27]
SKSGGGSGSDSGSSTPDLLRKREEPGREERPPFDSDAT